MHLSIHNARKIRISIVLCSLYKEIYLVSYCSFFLSKEILSLIFQIRPMIKIVR